MQNGGGGRPPGSHSKGWYKKRGLPVPQRKGDYADTVKSEAVAVQQQAASPVSPTLSHRKLSTGEFFGIVVGVLALIGLVLQMNGVIVVPWAWSIPIYLGLSCLVVYSFWIWEGVLSWKPLKRVILAVLIGLLLLVVSATGIISQYRREHVLAPTP